MKVTMQDCHETLSRRLAASGLSDPEATAWAASWLEACGYGGVGLLAEAMADGEKDVELVRDAIGLDLHLVSCAFLAPRIVEDVRQHGRVFLRNVRHGLFLLPFSVAEGIGIGCPVDPAFALGGERLKNPYAEKLALAEANGLDIDDTLWNSIGTG